jgi:LysM repeat protein
MRKSLLTLCMMGFCMAGMASEYSAMDSVGIEKVNGKTFIIHQIKEKETLFGISRRYDAPMNDIINENPKLADGLQPGQRIKIPYAEKAALPAGARMHKVVPGETLFSIARANQVTVQELMDWNELKANELNVGQNLIIKKSNAQMAGNTPAATAEAKPKDAAGKEKPKEAAAKAPATPAEVAKPSAEKKVESWTSGNTASTGNTDESGNWVMHTVDSGQTLFSIAKDYDAKVDDLIRWNMLTSTNLAPGQKLKVAQRGGGERQATSQPQAESVRPETNQAERGDVAEKWANAMKTSPGAAPSANDRPVVTSRTSQPEEDTSTERKNIKEVGQAEVIEGTGNHKKYLVLHRTAPVGTIMRIRNEENDVTIFARVVGKIPETGDNNRLLIKVSKAAYEQLKAVNSRFPVEVSY